MTGPAGIGKSAIAQSLCEGLGGKLGASFFFSRPNQRDDPDRFFISIAYQLADTIDSYADILDHTLNHILPTHQSLQQQFHNLLVVPLQELGIKGRNDTERVIIVDGLDECAGTKAQQDIVEIVIASVRARTTPFSWAFFSRPEPHLSATFTSPPVTKLSLRLEVPPVPDDEIMQFLKDEFAAIRKKRNLSPSWPTEQELSLLTAASSGLFAFATAAVRFLGGCNSAESQDRLRAITALTEQTIPHNSQHPLSHLDALYMLIMRHIPRQELETAQWILLATTLPGIGNNAIFNANLLRLSESQFRSSLRALHAVATLVHTFTGPEVYIYHESFMDFMQDPARSHDLCLRSACAVSLRSELLRRLDQLQSIQKPNCK